MTFRLFTLVALAVVVRAQEPLTQRLDLPSGGTLRLKNSIGELTITGWDRPAVEFTAIQTARPTVDQQALYRVNVKAEKNGSDVVIATTFANNFVLLRPFERATRFQLEYRISAPRAAKLDVDHESGEVHLEGILGDVRVTDGQGLITIRLPEEASPAIDARSKLGAIDSDFPGNLRKKLKFGHTFLESESSGAQKIYLRIGFGDINIMRDSRPQPSPASASK